MHPHECTCHLHNHVYVYTTSTAQNMPQQYYVLYSVRTNVNKNAPTFAWQTSWMEPDTSLIGMKATPNLPSTLLSQRTKQHQTSSHTTVFSIKHQQSYGTMASLTCKHVRSNQRPSIKAPLTSVSWAIHALSHSAPRAPRVAHHTCGSSNCYKTEAYSFIYVGWHHAVK